MNKKTNNNKFISDAHFMILGLVFVTFGLFYCFYTLYFNMDEGSETFYKMTSFILLMSYVLTKLFMIMKENNSSIRLIGITLVLYIIIFGILALPFMIVSFVQYDIKAYAFLHTSFIIIIIEKLGRIYISKRLNKKEKV
jgi:hypothetical protein